MALFGHRIREPFWRVPPFRTGDPAVLYHHGIACVTRSDGPGMLSTAWALWNIAGLDAHQADDFLYEGYGAWSAAGASIADRTQFLEEVFDRLETISPAVPVTIDVFSLPEQVAQRASRLYGTRGWAAVELLELDTQHSVVTPERRQRILVALEATPPSFMAARTDIWLQRLRQEPR